MRSRPRRAVRPGVWGLIVDLSVLAGVAVVLSLFIGAVVQAIVVTLYGGWGR